MAQKTIFKDGIKVNDSFLDGFKMMFRSIITVMENKDLIKYFIVPFMLNIVILTGVFYFSYTMLNSWLSEFLADGSMIYKIVRFLIKPALIIILFMASVLIYSTVGSIIISPFNDIISLRTEEKLSGKNFNGKFSMGVFISDMARTLMNIIKLLFMLLAINIILLIINLIPFLGSFIYGVISFLATAFFLGFQFFDFPLDRRRLVFREKLKVLARFKFMVMGLGAGFFVFSFIPVINYLGLNLGAMGATILFIDNIKPALSGDTKSL